MPLTDDLIKAHNRVNKLLEQQQQLAPGAILPEALQELNTALEELRVADEELRRQNEMLLESDQQIQDERQRYHDLFEFAPEAFLVTDFAGVIRESNRAASQLLKVESNYLVGKPVFVWIPYEHQRQLRLTLHQLESQPKEVSTELRLKPRKGPERDVSLKIGVMMDAAGVPQYLLWQLQDITEQNKIFLALKASEEENRNKQLELSHLNRRLFETQEQERRNIARELHDEIGQSLTGLKLTMDMMTAAVSAQNRDYLKNCMEIVAQIINQVRYLALDLRPPMLDDLGLVPSLLWLFKRFTQQTEIAVRFVHHNCDIRMGTDVETAAYRIIQEALTNAARYAGVDEIKVHVYVQELTLHLNVQDAGIGFDWRAALSARQSTGLSGMMERATLLGGQVNISSEPDSGTIIRASIPIAKDFGNG